MPIHRLSLSSESTSKGFKGRASCSCKWNGPVRNKVRDMVKDARDHKIKARQECLSPGAWNW